MLLQSIIALLAASLLAQAAPTPAAVARSGYFAEGAPLAQIIDQYCSKHPCGQFHNRDSPFLDAAAAATASPGDDGTSFDLPPELSPVVEGLRNGSGGTFA